MVHRSRCNTGARARSRPRRGPFRGETPPSPKQEISIGETSAPPGPSAKNRGTIRSSLVTRRRLHLYCGVQGVAADRAAAASALHTSAPIHRGPGGEPFQLIDPQVDACFEDSRIERHGCTRRRQQGRRALQAYAASATHSPARQPGEISRRGQLRRLRGYTKRCLRSTASPAMFDARRNRPCQRPRGQRLECRWRWKSTSQEILGLIAELRPQPPPALA